MIEPMFRGREQDCSQTLRQFLQWSAAEPELSGGLLLEAWFRRDSLRAEVLAQMREYPILLCPPAAVTAFRHGERSWTIDGQSVHYLDAWSYAEWFNLLGNPAAVVPVSHSTKVYLSASRLLAALGKRSLYWQSRREVEKGCNGCRIPPLAQRLRMRFDFWRREHHVASHLSC